MKCHAVILKHAFSLPLCVLVLCALAPASDDAPQWLKQAVSISVPAYEKEVPAVRILHEQGIAVDAGGHRRTLIRGALRILQQQGRESAVARTYYRTDGEKVREMDAWVVSPSGKVRRYGKKEQIDMAAASGDTYNEVRARAISAAEDAEIGAVFGYEILTEETPLFNQLEWQFQDRLPVIQSRFTLEVPVNWRVESTTFNHAPGKPDVSGGQYKWELRNLPFIKEEPASPRLTDLAARVGISYFPPFDSNRPGGRTFQSWEDVSSWLAGLNDPQTVPSDAIASKVKELTANAGKESERVRAIARYVQDIRYISIQTGLGRGGGYLPHPAAEVFGKSYGDCKDKAALMRAMLKAAGIQSYSVAVYALDPRHVREEWPTPQQFNHVIVGVSLGEDSFSTMTIVHPSFGRLLFFDPTDPDTACGDLPEIEQGSLALLVAAQGGALARLPSSLPEANQIERNIDVSLSGQGSIAGRIHEQATGQAGAAFRQEYLANPGSRYREVVEKWIARGVNGARIVKLEPLDSSTGSFETNIEFVAEAYAQLMQNRLLIFRPAFVSRREDIRFTEPSRTHPVVISPEVFTERSTFKIPEGFAVDESPGAIQLEAAFGAYSASIEVKQRDLLFTRKLLLKRDVVPAEQYSKVRDFFERIRNAERTPVVLVRR